MGQEVQDERRRWSRRLTRAAVIAVACLVVLNVGDLLTTRFALHLTERRTHALVEANPLARALLPGGRIEAVKLLLIALLAWNTARRPATLKIVCAAWATVGIYAMVIANNLLAIWAIR